jgi:hypothetical protein
MGSNRNILENEALPAVCTPFVDLPRIADNPEFMKPSVIYDHIIKGKWFLGSKTIPRSEPRDVPLNTPI